MIRLTYKISTGEFFEADELGRDVLVAHGYSGTPEHRNDPKAVELEGEGPIPPGRYLVGAGGYSMKTGPMTFHLSQVDGQSYGRGGFAIHGDNSAHAASHGCIILPRVVRMGLQASQRADRFELIVVA